MKISQEDFKTHDIQIFIKNAASIVWKKTTIEIELVAIGNQ